MNTTFKSDLISEDNGNLYSDKTIVSKESFSKKNFVENYKNSDKNFSDTSARVLSSKDSAYYMLIYGTTEIEYLDPWMLDSTARLEQFKYRYKPNYIANLEYKKRQSIKSFYLNNRISLNYEIIENGGRVKASEKIGTIDISQPTVLSLNDYIEKRIKYENKKNYIEQFKYEAKEQKKNLSSFLTNITDIQIPIPATSFLSIFGPPKINLRVGGAIDIHAGFRNEKTEGITVSRFGNTRNEPDFKQQIQLNLSGTIGDKLRISADWNTERDFEYQNQLKIKYTGYEDEIVQNVEAGNVSMQTSPLIGGGEALFGVKANFQLGSFKLTTLASQKKGEIKEVSLTGGTSFQEVERRAYDYSKNHYFIDTIYASSLPQYDFFYKYYSSPTLPLDPNMQFYQIKQIEVWKSVTSGIRDENRERNVVALINLPFKRETDLYDNIRNDSLISEKFPPGSIEIGRFIRLNEKVDYEYNRYTGHISLKTNVNENEAIAVAYSIEGQSYNNEDDVYYGEFASLVPEREKILVLKLVKPRNLQPQFKTAWKLQLKNIYPTGGRNLQEEGFEFNILYKFEGQEETPIINGINLLSAFELDKYSGSSNSIPQPDQKFDFIVGRTILPETGEIIFPRLQPFGRNLPSSLPDTIKYLSVYDTTAVIAQQDRARDKFILKIKYSGQASSTYNIGFNVVENSVRVTLAGRELTPGIDYIVDYNIGQVTIKNPAALAPNADLRITYEQNDLFQLASKTLLGARGLWDISSSTKFGFSALNLTQQTLSDKVRIGEEPISNSIYGMDFATSVDFPFLTKFADFVSSTSVASTLNVRGEFAYINPDPNTKKSPIKSDKKESIAYIDDFEGAKRTIPIGVNYTGWKDISPPDQVAGLENLTKRQMMDYKAKTFWYNELPPRLLVQEIWPEKTAARGDEFVTALDLVFDPTKRGQYNYSPKLDNPNLLWGGAMRLLSPTANNLLIENIEFIEFWFNPIEIDQNAALFIDLGLISEDIIPNNILDTEDKNGNGLLDPGEDTGLDGKKDSEEPGYDPTTNPDPSGDNFAYNFGSLDYSNINGTEGNGLLSDAGQFPDTEDLNRNNTLDLLNSYFRYRIPLDTNRANNPFIVSNNKRWYQIRISLKDFAAKVGNPSLSLVEAIRMWIGGSSKRVHLRFVEMNLVGNQWQKVPPIVNGKPNPDDDVLTLTVVNVEDNPKEYRSPVPRERDRSKPDQQIFRNEQSLSLILKNLPDGQKREVFKNILRPYNLFNYSELKFLARPDENSSYGQISYYENENSYSAEFYIRFGSDTLNYYEYRFPIRKINYNDGWIDVSIKFKDLTALKQLRDTIVDYFKVPVQGESGSFYAIKGNPTLTRVSFFLFGIENPRGKNVEVPISGYIWINELRIIGAENTPGWAYTASSSLKIADLMTVSYNISQTDPYFHKLETNFGSKFDIRNWSGSIDVDLMKFLPLNMPNSNLRLNYTRSESKQSPLYLPNSDVFVTSASKQLRTKLLQDGIPASIAEKEALAIVRLSETVNINESYTLSNIKFVLPYDSWIARYSLNSLSFSYNFSKSYSRNPSVIKNNRWQWNGSVNYQIAFPQDYSFKFYDLPVISTILDLLPDYKNSKFNYVPQNFNFNLSANRRYDFTLNRPLRGQNLRYNPPSQDLAFSRNGSFSWRLTEGGFINWNLNYRANANSTLAYLLTENGIERKESEIWNDILSREMFGKDVNYSQSFELRTSPRLPSFWGLGRNINLNASYSSQYDWNRNLHENELGRSAGVSKNINLGTNIRVKSLLSPLFEEENRTSADRGGKVVSLEGRKDTSASSLDRLFVLSKKIFYFLLVDYENLSVNFTSTTKYSGSGLYGIGSGFYNFWGIKYNENNGPSRSFMLGLSSDLGKRAPNALLTNVRNINNTLDYRTSKPLWENVTMELNWRVNWNENIQYNLRTDNNSNVEILSKNSSESVNRSFFTLPPFLIFSLFDNGISKVNELYRKSNRSPEDLAKAFEEGFETAPWISKYILKGLGRYIPRANYRLSWSGLEKFFLFESFASRVSLEHAYKSGYSQNLRINPNGKKDVIFQSIDYGFQPLASLNIGFKPLWNGNLSGTVRYNTNSRFDLGTTTKTINETYTQDIGFTLSFSKSGFELPAFGISLKNDIEFSLSYSLQRNSSILYEMEDFKEEGKPVEGNIRTTLEPRFKYVLSQRVTMSVYYRRNTTEPEGASRIPPTTTNEAGLDLRISIQ